MKILCLFILLLTCNYFIHSQSKADNYLKKANEHYESGEFDLSFQYFDSASASSILTEDLNLYVESLIGKGKAKRYNEADLNYELAAEYFYQAFELLQHMPLRAPRQLAEVAYNLATTERLRLNYLKALDYGQLALRMGSELNDNIFKSKTHNMMANILSNQGHPEIAISHFKNAVSLRKSVGIKNDEILRLYHRNMGLNYVEAGEYLNAISALNDALRLQTSINRSDAYNLADIHYSLGLAHQGLDSFEKAREAYFKTESLLQNELREKGIAIIYWQLGNLYRQFNKHDSAIYFIQKALMPGIHEVNSPMVLQVPELREDIIDDLPLVIDVFNILDDRGLTLLELYNKTGEVKYLNGAGQTYKLADNLMLSARININEDDPSLQIARLTKGIYEHGLRVLFTLHRVEESEEFTGEAYKFMERTKQAILLKNRLASRQIGSARDFDVKIRKIQGAIDEMRRKIVLAEKGAGGQFQFIDNMIDQLAVLHASKGELLDEYSHDVDTTEFQVINLQKMQDYLSSGQMLLNFFWGDSNIYIVAATKTNSGFHQLKKSDVEENINKLLAVLNSNPLEPTGNDFSVFSTSAHKIYQALIGPFDNLIKDKNINELVIVPDGKLNRLPVSTLIRDKSRAGRFKDLSYLIKDYVISYTLSGSLLTTEEIRDEGNQSFLGFASGSLPGTEKELNVIAGLWPEDNRVYDGYDATEQAFKEQASQYDIIHLASHAYPGDSIFQANLIFAEDPSSEEDGRLFTYEVYPLKLKARMTVLSACETGVGENFEGEGVFSLARGFVYAGSSTVVMSLWKIIDFHATRLMAHFYNELKEGVPVGQAMRAAQLQYLSDNYRDGAHPANWSSFIVMGKGTQSFGTQWLGLRASLLWVTLLIIILISVISIRKFVAKKG